MPFTHEEIQQLPDILSAPRFATYLSVKGGDKVAALELYRWNLELSAAFFVPLQICEVALRNSIVRAIEKIYGPTWPWQKGFEVSLPDPPRGYSARRELDLVQKQPTSGKVVAELKLAFWEKMLTRRHDGAIWNAQFRTAFPHTDPAKSVQTLRREAYETVSTMGDLRNRIAHHEPIFPGI